MPTGTNAVAYVTQGPSKGTVPMWMLSFSGTGWAEVVAQIDGNGNVLDGTGRLQGGAVAPSIITAGGTAVAAGSGRVMALHAVAVGADDTITFVGGTLDGLVITVRSGLTFDWTPATEQTCLTHIVFGRHLDGMVEWA